MKNLVTIGVVLLTFCFFSCEDPNMLNSSYPRKYKVDSQSFNNVDYFVVVNGNLEAVSPNNGFLSVSSEIEEEVSIDVLGLLFEEFELLDESSVKVLLDFGNGVTLDTVLQYEEEGDNIIIGSNTPTPILLGGMSSMDEFKQFYWSYFYSYYDENLDQQELSPVIVELSSSPDETPEEWLEQFILDGTIEDSDTIGIQGFTINYTQEN